MKKAEDINFEKAGTWKNAAGAEIKVVQLAEKFHACSVHTHKMVDFGKGDYVVCTDGSPLMGIEKEKFEAAWKQVDQPATITEESEEDTDV